MPKLLYGIYSAGAEKGYFMKTYKQKYYIKVYKKGKMVSSFDTAKSKRFFFRGKAVKFLESTTKVYIKVTYPYELSGIQAYNDGTYTNHKDLIQAMKAFIEK